MITWTQQKLGVIKYFFYVLILFMIFSLMIFIYIGRIDYVIMQLIATFIIIFLLVAFNEVGDNYYKTFPVIKKEEQQESLLKCLITEHLDIEKEIEYEGVTTFKMQKLGLTLYLNYRTTDPNTVLIKLVGVKENNYSEATKITEIIDGLFINHEI